MAARFAFGNTGVCTVTYIPTRNRWLVMALNDQTYLEAGNQPIGKSLNQQIQMLIAREQLE